MRPSVSPIWIRILILIAVLAGPPALTDAAEPPRSVREVLEEHCVSCHDPTAKSGGLDLRGLLARPIDGDPSRFAVWVKVHDRARSGEMPPKGEPRPVKAAIETMTRDLAGVLTTVETDRRRAEGRSAVRRLNRTEYENTMRDLFELPGLAVRDRLPEDGRSRGYDKASGGLDVSTVHLAKFMEAADAVLDSAIAKTLRAPQPQRVRMDPPDQYDYSILLSNSDAVFLKDFRYDPRIPLISDKWADHGALHRAGIFKTPGTVGVFRHQDEAFLGRFASFGSIFPGAYKVRFSIWGYRWDKGKVLPNPKTEAAALLCGGRVIGHFDAPSLKPTIHEVRVWMHPEEWLSLNAASLWPVRVSERPGRAAGFVGPGVAIDWVEIEGPIHERWPTSAHRRIFGDLPLVAFDKLSPRAPKPDREAPRQRTRDGRNGPGPFQFATVKPSATPKADADRLLRRFLPRAFRGPVAEEEAKRYLRIATDRLDSGSSFEDAMRAACRAALCSPDFLYLRESPGRLEDWALASRLSYFFWGSMPDSELFQLAHAGKLRDPQTLRAQTERMLNDPKAERFLVDFPDQWLDLRDIDFTSPDRQLYPEFSPQLRSAMLDESRAFFRELVRANAPIRLIARSDFAMLNQKLAEHYGVPGVSGTAIRKVALPRSSHRGGFLTQAAILKITANGTTTSPVKRGAWVQGKILGRPPEPPPPNTPAIEPDVRGATTIREMLAKHRADPSCAACHAKIDPPGFALESFDVIGGWRDRYRALGQGDPPKPALISNPPPYAYLPYRLGPKVDSSGRTADGEPFADIGQFQALLVDDQRQLARNLLNQLLIYATGAPVGFSDRADVEQALDRSAGDGFPIRSLIHEVVRSPAFQMK